MKIKTATETFDAVDCRHWRVQRSAQVCAAGHDVNACGACPHRVSREGNWSNPPVILRANGQPAKIIDKTLPARGLGDVVARALEAVGIRKRKGCKCGKRQEALNRWFPFGKKK